MAQSMTPATEPPVAGVARRLHQHLSLADDVKSSNRALRDVLTGAAAAVEVGQFAIVTDRLSSVAGDLQERVEPTLQATHEAMAALTEFTQTLDAFTAGFDRIRTRTEAVMRATAQIVGIAKQSSLLALNARIESHRAGQAGAGFRVVSEEFGKLAQRTQLMSEEISGAIRGIQEAVVDTSAQLEAQFAQNRETLERASQAIKLIDRTAHEIAGGTESLGQVVQQVELIAYKQVALQEAMESMQRHSDWIERAAASLVAELREVTTETDRLWAAALPTEQQSQVESLQRFEEQFVRALREDRPADGRAALQGALDQGFEPLLVIERIGAAAARTGLTTCDTQAVETIFRNSLIIEEALATLEPRLGESGTGRSLVLLGNAFEDYHDLGRRLVSVSLRAAGFRVIDLGNSVKNEDFVRAAREHQPAVIGVSAHLLHTAKWIPSLKEALAKQGLGSIPLIAGGAPFLVDPELGQRYGLQAVGRSPHDAVRIVRSLTAVRGGGR